MDPGTETVPELAGEDARVTWMRVGGWLGLGVKLRVDGVVSKKWDSYNSSLRNGDRRER